MSWLQRQFDRFLAAGLTATQQAAQASQQQAGSWPVRWTVSAVAGINGVELIFPAPPNGITWIGAVNVTGGTGADLYTIYLGQPGMSGPPLSSWLGGSTYGPVAVNDMQTLSIIGTSFALNSTLVATFSGIAYLAAAAPLSYPLPLASTGVTAQSLSVASLGAGPVTQTWTVPPGVTQAIVNAAGGQGLSSNVDGGLGGQVTGVLAVTPGDVLSLVAGSSGLIPPNASGGQASTIVDTTTTTLLLVVGGGGAAGTLQTNPGGGGTGGGTTGGTGLAPFPAIAAAGLGGTQSAGGTGGASNDGKPGLVGAGPATAGSPGAGLGGLGGGGGAAGGDGGDGFYGGGGGAQGLQFGSVPIEAGGGGGSSFWSSALTTVTDLQGVNGGAGFITLTWVA